MALWLALAFSLCLAALLLPVREGVVLPPVFSFLEGGAILFQLRTTARELLVTLPLLTAIGWGIGRWSNQPQDQQSVRRIASLLLLLIALTAGTLLAIMAQRHHAFHTNAFDLGIFTQLFWNLSHGNGLECSLRGLPNMLAEHASPAWWLLAPVQRIAPGAEIMLLLQWLLLMGALWPLILLLRKRLPLMGVLLVAAAWTLYAPLHWFALFDVHEHALTPLLTFALVHQWEERRWRPVALLALLLLGVKEEMGIIVAALGLMLALTDRPARTPALLLMLAGAGWIAAYTLLIHPTLREEGVYFFVHRYAWLGDSPGAVIQTLLTNPGRWLPRFAEPRPWLFLGLLLLPLGGLPLRGLRWLLVMLPTFGYSVLSDEPLQTSIYAQYTGPWMPFLFLALREALQRPSPAWLAGMRGAWIACCCAFLTGLVLSPLPWGRPDLRQRLTPRPWDATVRQWIVEGTLPADASVSAVSRYTPHLAARPELTLFPNLIWREGVMEFVLLDLQSLQSAKERGTAHWVRQHWEPVASDGLAELWRRPPGRALPPTESDGLPDPLPPVEVTAFYAGDPSPSTLRRVILTDPLWQDPLVVQALPEGVRVRRLVLPDDWQLSPEEFVIRH